MFRTKLNKYIVKGFNREEFNIISKEIFVDDIYKFSINNNPYIIDLGSHIGVSILYFKTLYPKAKILGVEPNPLLFPVLKENILTNGLNDIEILNLAISNEPTLKLFIDNTKLCWYSTGGYQKGGWTHKQSTKEITVSTIKLSSLLKIPVDILKIDIEGLEDVVISEAEDKLDLVKNIVIEYHPSSKNKLSKMLKILRKYFSLKYYIDGKEIREPNYLNLMVIKGYKN